MTTRANSKQGRPVTKSNPKNSVKDSTKGDKQPTNVLEIVPGKFNETDWLTIIENDDTEDYIADIFERIWTETSKQIQEMYIQRQALPYTLMITENALSNVIQWAFLERDEPQPSSGDFWTEDSEPIPCTMDNWGEGVVPACREERPQSVEQLAVQNVDRPSTAPVNNPLLGNVNPIERPSTALSTTNSIHTSRSSTRTKKPTKDDESKRIPQQIKQEPSIKIDGDDHRSSQNDSSAEGNTSSSSSFVQKPYYHDVLVIHTQPPKLEPLAGLFSPSRIAANGSSSYSTPLTLTKKHRYMIVPKASPQAVSETLTSTTNMTETTMTKSFKPANQSKVFDHEHVERAISKAPLATQSMLKSILSRPPKFRELELDDYGNVIAIAKLDPDKFAPRSIHVKCDVVKPKKPIVETRGLPVKPIQRIKPDQSESNFLPVKLVLPEQSTDIGDLIQPAPGVLYEDSRLKKGDPRRYQDGMSNYTNFYDENRPLKPIAPRNDLATLQAANELLSHSKDRNRIDDLEQDSQLPKLHRLPRVPPILSRSSTSST